jgi:hypothetical protein
MTDLIEDFTSRVKERLRAGAVEYGDASFGRSMPSTAQEILQEIEDVAGWAFVMWVQMRRRLAGVLLAEQQLQRKGQP